MARCNSELLRFSQHSPFYCKMIHQKSKGLEFARQTKHSRVLSNILVTCDDNQALTIPTIIPHTCPSSICDLCFFVLLQLFRQFIHSHPKFGEMPPAARDGLVWDDSGLDLAPVWAREPSLEAIVNVCRKTLQVDGSETCEVHSTPKGPSTSSI